MFKCGDAIPHVSVKYKILFCLAPKAASSQFRRLEICINEDDQYVADHMIDYACTPQQLREGPHQVAPPDGSSGEKGCLYHSFNSTCHPLSHLFRYNHMHGADPAAAEAIWEDDGYLRLAVVRNPMTRIVSAFRTVTSTFPPEQSSPAAFRRWLEDNVVGPKAQARLLEGATPSCPPLDDDLNAVAQHWYPQHCR